MAAPCLAFAFRWCRARRPGRGVAGSLQTRWMCSYPGVLPHRCLRAALERQAVTSRQGERGFSVRWPHVGTQGPPEGHALMRPPLSWPAHVRHG
jgi:hypothetical protein